MYCVVFAKVIIILLYKHFKYVLFFVFNSDFYWECLQISRICVTFVAQKYKNRAKIHKFVILWKIF